MSLPPAAAEARGSIPLSTTASRTWRIVIVRVIIDLMGGVVSGISKRGVTSAAAAVAVTSRVLICAGSRAGL
jgi:hypothetical protein